MAEKRRTKSKKKEEADHFARYQTTIIASVTILLIVVLFILSRSGIKEQRQGIDDNDAGLSATTSNRSLLATVNDEPIYMDEVSRLYSTLPPAQQNNETLQQAFDTVVNNKLLIQDAKSRGIDAAEADADNTIDSMMKQGNFTQATLIERLAAIGLTITDFRNEIRETLVLKQEIEYLWTMVQPPSDEQIRSYYNDNKANITSIPKAKVRQLLIKANSSNSEEKLNKIKAIADELNKTDFCALVTRYSEDVDDVVARCGVYEFQKGELVPEFEDVALLAPKGSIIIVPTRLGYHLVEMLERTPAAQLSFEETKEAIASQLLSAKRQTLLTGYINELRKKATIVSAQGN
ncbi:MAG: SurA N-terminal domain-containing protein [archaeon]